MFKAALLVGATSTLLIATAHAADIEAPPEVYEWTGGYIGLQAGYAFDNQSTDANVDPPGVAVDIDIDSIDLEGFVGGVHAGYLFQSDGLVVGIEGDIEYADLTGKADLTVTAGAAPVEFADIENKIDWLGSLRLRLGLAMDRVLFYGTGGLAVGGVELEANANPILAGLVSDASDDETKWGWTLGGGIEYAVYDDISLRVEYRYTDLGSSEVVQLVGAAQAIESEVDNTFHAVRGGVSWHFR